MSYQFLWIDGFDYANDFAEVYTNVLEYAENGAKYSGSDVPYNYGKATALNGSAENYIYKTLTGAPFTTLFIAFHWYWDDTSDATERTFLQFWDTANNGMQVEVRRLYNSATGEHLFRVYRGSTILGTTSAGVTPGQWAWVSFKCYCDPTAGNFQININGVNRLNYTGNTMHLSAAQMHRIKLTTGVSVGTGFRVDNLVIATGNPSDLPIPECRVFGDIVPTGNDSIEFNPNAGSNWSNVDEIGPDEDTSYNYSTTVGATDTFLGDLSAVGSVIYAVKVNVRARKDDAGTRSVCPVIKPATTVYEGAEIPVTPDYLTYGHIWQTNPDTGLQWTQAEISNLKWGYRLKS